MMLAALVFVGRYGSSFPLNFDDWYYVPYLTGNQPVTFAWLWEQYADHRYPVTKAVYWGLLKLTGGDYRSILFFNVLTLGAVAFAMIWTARSVRGWMSYTDAFFPLLMLNWGLSILHFLWASGLYYVLPTVLALTLFLIMVRRGTQLTPGSGFLAGLCLVLLALSGGTGILFTPALGLWLVISGIHLWRTRWRSGLIVLALAGAAVAIVPLYFIGYEAHHYGAATTPSFWAKFQVGLAFLAAGFGPVVVDYWVYPGVALLALWVLGLGILVAALGRQEKKGTVPLPQGDSPLFVRPLLGRQEASVRSRAWGLWFYTGGVGCLVLGIAWGREGRGPKMATMYQALDFLFLCYIYFVWIIPRRHALGFLGQLSLLAATLFLLYPNTQFGAGYGKYQRSSIDAFERDLREGQPLYLLQARHHAILAPEDMGGVGPWLLEDMRLLHQAGIGPFQHLQENPPFRAIPISPRPTAVANMTWEDGAGQGTGLESHLTFTLPRPMFVAGIRLRGIITGHFPDYYPRSRVFWKNGAEAAFPEEPQNRLFWDQPGEVSQAVVYIGDTIDRIRLHPHNQAFHLQVLEMAVLVPDVESGP
jgi:hypothetical protein